MWEVFVSWVKSLFANKPIQAIEQEVEQEVEQEPTQIFNGWIKDVKDIRDQIFTGER